MQVNGQPFSFILDTGAPAAWSVIGAYAICAFGMLEDLALPIAAAIALIFRMAARPGGPVPMPGVAETDNRRTAA